MDVPLELYDIRIQKGLKGCKRKSSTYCHNKADVIGLSALYEKITCLMVTI